MLQHEAFRMTTQHPLEHLDSEALQNLIDRYYAGENVTVLLKEFDNRVNDTTIDFPKPK